MVSDIPLRPLAPRREHEGVFLEVISKMLSQSPFDAPDFVGIAQGEQIPVHPE
jgi:hypothetical protein